MRSLLTLVGAAAVTFAVVGWFLGWYKVHTTPGPDGHREVQIDFNGPKIKQDLKTGEDKIRNLTQNVTAGTSAPAAPASPGTVMLPPLPVPPSPAPQTSPPAPEPVIITPLPIPVSAPASEGNGQPWQYQPH
jgi:hypothetical protein